MRGFWLRSDLTRTVWLHPGISGSNFSRSPQMLERSRFFRLWPRIAAWASLSAIALMAGAVEPAEAKAIKQSVIKIDSGAYARTINSHVFRLYLNNANFDPKSVD